MKRFSPYGLFCLPLVLALLPTPAMAEDEMEAQVRAAVEDYYAYTREHLSNPADAIAADGSLQFWSSGGLMLSIGPDESPVEYESFDVHPKHISVIRLSDEAATVAYYAEGSMRPQGSAGVPRYLTRVLAVYVKEGDSWKIRAGHWSPLQGGGGTTRSTE